MASRAPEQVDALRLAVIRLERKLRKSAGSGEVTPSQYSALFALDRHGPFRLSELGRREQIGKSTVTRLVAGLEARGLVSRAVDDVDARSSIVAITDAGRALLIHLAERSNDYLRDRVDELDAADQDRLFDAVEALAKLGAPR
ncbi:DNA-binding transcriptional regulator, MarR family [Nocardioides terrae]|uniref:DNA-binding transcriptional regulator, MarR family n=1 Tax=Nocardioides terrae TaxID=574651 RepID=A0A1I1EEI1_9ACTN|nr:MarR family transcriptional regulator [Nocardioides terrae]SFB85559.1 DNA-binding transcriptional regulator, MarR family [Nocardioides terrae]